VVQPATGGRIDLDGRFCVLCGIEQNTMTEKRRQRAYRE
jgi:hypothetical protein